MSEKQISDELMKLVKKAQVDEEFGSVLYAFMAKREKNEENKKLLEKTGGIVQGMSGSPVIQNGRLVGAVTHVLVNDPTRGYGIFIENMLGAAG